MPRPSTGLSGFNPFWIAIAAHAAPALAGPQGCPLFSAAVQDTGGSGVRGIVTADFNEDGIADLAEASDQGLVIMIGQGSGGVGNGLFAAPVFRPQQFALRLETGDFNDDGIADIVALDGSLSFRIYLGQGSGGIGNGSFGAPTTFGSTPNGNEGLAVGDFDEDGISDLAIVGQSPPNQLVVFRGLGSMGLGTGGFTLHASYALRGPAQHVTTGDFDEDGILDLAVMRTDDSVAVLLGTGAAGRGDGGFGAPTLYGVGPVPGWDIDTGDFDEDGITDLVASGGSRLAILRGKGGGGVGDGRFFDGIVYPAGGPRELAVGDWNGDGIADVAVGGTSNSVSVCLGNGIAGSGDGTLGAPTAFTIGGTPISLVPGDFLEDGVADLAVGHFQGSARVSMLWGACPPSVSVAVAVTSPNGGESWPVEAERTIAWTKGEGVIAVDVEVSRDGGANWKTIAHRLTETSFAWTVTPPPTDRARVRVRDSTVPGRADLGDADFEIAAPKLDVRPDGGERWRLTGSPNPFSRGVTLVLGLDRAAVVQVVVHDLSGRRVRALIEGSIEAGRHTVTWDGRDGRGREAPDGVYLVRARAGEREAVRRIVRVR